MKVYAYMSNQNGKFFSWNKDTGQYEDNVVYPFNGNFPEFHSPKPVECEKSNLFRNHEESEVSLMMFELNVSDTKPPPHSGLHHEEVNF